MGRLLHRKSTTTCDFAEKPLENIYLSVSGDNNSAIVGTFEDFSLTQNKAGFIDPEPANGRDCIIRGIGDVREDVKVTYKFPVLSEESAILIEEPYIYQDADGNNVDGDNRVFILASLHGENNTSFTDGGGDPNDPGGNSDQKLGILHQHGKKRLSRAGTHSAAWRLDKANIIY